MHDRIASAVDIIRSGRYDAAECNSCRFCQFATSCPVSNQTGRRAAR
ncbi:hypothetical protein G7085_00610 [Tessaracoccus sp. HDW20]|nr:hypothetical protein [Tessaracoccus coleopterorum]NHB83703.1 hypothetical protein [Tessaracoccus coleopterorum]